MRLVVNVAKEVRASLLRKETSTDGCCYDASRSIAQKLLSLGYKPKLVKGFVKLDGAGIFGKGFHFWIELEGTIIDVTGDQFNTELLEDRIPEIVVAPTCKLKRYMMTTYEPLHLPKW